jgi:hypothetical protein
MHGALDGEVGTSSSLRGGALKSAQLSALGTTLRYRVVEPRGRSSIFARASGA